jgi:hypothetical protein
MQLLFLFIHYNLTDMTTPLLLLDRNAVRMHSWLKYGIDFIMATTEIVTFMTYPDTTSGSINNRLVVRDTYLLLNLTYLRMLLASTSAAKFSFSCSFPEIQNVVCTSAKKCFLSSPVFKSRLRLV